VVRRSIILIALIAAACGFSPVVVQLIPRYEAPRSEIGVGKTVLLEVRDARADPEVGRRQHGLLPGSRIELAAPIETTVRDALASALRRQRFTVVTEGTAATRLSIEVVELQYHPNGAPVGPRITTSASIRAVATSAGGRYSRVYSRADQDAQVIGTSGHFNGARLSALLSDTFRQLIADEALIAILAAD